MPYESMLISVAVPGVCFDQDSRSTDLINSRVWAKTNGPFMQDPTSEQKISDVL